MASRSDRARIAEETVRIIDTGTYRTTHGDIIDIREVMERARSGSILYTPEMLNDLQIRMERGDPQHPSVRTTFEATNEMTLAAAARILAADPSARVAALNFASAKNPGGGFLNGSQAQEESLARTTGIYPCIARQKGMYDVNRKIGTTLYTDHMIYSPDVPVIRDDEDHLLSNPFPVSFITAPAVNAGAVRRNEPEKVKRIEPVMIERIEKVLTVAALHGHRHLVLGAWGCGVFENDPRDMARWFGRHLLDGAFRGIFSMVVFAVYDRSPDLRFLRPFTEIFGG
jgi:uncharacterized protein (TIGR02452 family)